MRRLAARRRVDAVIGVVVAVLVTGACSTGVAGKVVDAAAKEVPTHAVAPAPGSATNSPPPTASTPDAVPTPSEDEARRVVRTVPVVPTKTDGTLDDAEAARRFAEPVLSLVRASWRIAKPDYRLSGQLVPGFTVADVWRPPTSPGGDRWFAVSGTDVYDPEPKFLVFRAGAADPAWKLAFVTHMWEGTSFPGIALTPDKAAQTVSSGAGLVGDPGAACAALTARQNAAAWGPHVEETDRQRLKSLNEEVPYGINTTFFSKSCPNDAVGPVWRAADGGALVPCVQQNRWAAELAPGASPIAWYGESRYLEETPDLRMRSWVDTNISMVLIHIPASGTAAPPTAKPDVAATVTYPLDWTFVPYS